MATPDKILALVDQANQTLEGPGHAAAVAKVASTTVATEGLPKWKANTAYPINTIVLAPDGTTVKATVAFTSGTTYSAANWTTVSTGLAAASSTEAKTGTSTTKAVTPKAAADTFYRQRARDIRTLGIYPADTAAAAWTMDHSTALQPFLDDNAYGPLAFTAGHWAFPNTNLFDSGFGIDLGQKGSTYLWKTQLGNGGQGTGQVIWKSRDLSVPLTSGWFSGDGEWGVPDNTVTRQSDGSYTTAYDGGFLAMWCNNLTIDRWNVKSYGLKCRLMTLAGDNFVFNDGRIVGEPPRTYDPAQVGTVGSDGTTITKNAHGLALYDQVQVNNGATGLPAGTYFVKTSTTNTFTLSTVRGLAANTGITTGASINFQGLPNLAGATGLRWFGGDNGQVNRLHGEGHDDFCGMVVAIDGPWLGMDINDFWWTDCTGYSTNGRVGTAGLNAGGNDGVVLLTSSIRRSGWIRCRGKYGAHAFRAYNRNSSGDMEVTARDCSADGVDATDLITSAAIQAQRVTSADPAYPIGSVTLTVDNGHIKNPLGTSVQGKGDARVILTGAGRYSRGRTVSPVIDMGGSVEVSEETVVDGRRYPVGSDGKYQRNSDGTRVAIQVGGPTAPLINIDDNSGSSTATLPHDCVVDAKLIGIGAPSSTTYAIKVASGTNFRAGRRIRYRAAPGVVNARAITNTATGTIVEPGADYGDLNATRIVDTGTGTVLPAATTSGFAPVAFSGAASDITGVSADLAETAVTAATATLAAGVLSAVTGAGPYAAPALSSSTSPAQRFAIHNRGTASVVLNTLSAAGAAIAVTILPGSSHTYRQTGTVGYFLESGIPMIQLDGRYVQRANNLSDLADAPTARTNLGLGAAATKGVGTSGTQVAAGDDSRFTDSRTPTAHHGTHSTGGTDAIAPADIGAPALDATGHLSLGVQRQMVRQEAALRPAGVMAQNMRRDDVNNQSVGPTAGKINLYAIYLLAGTVVSSITFTTGSGTAGSGMTHNWYGLWDANLNRLAVTNDDTTTTWTVATTRTLNLPTAYTVTADGLFYVSIDLAATTVPPIAGRGVSATSAAIAPRMTAVTTNSYVLPSDAPTQITETLVNLSGYAQVLVS